MDAVKGSVAAAGGVTSSASAATLFAVNHNADNGLVTLRYLLKDADFQVAEEPFEAEGTKFNRGSFLISKVDAANLNKITTELGLKAYGLSTVPGVKTHPARAARVALMHTWQSTQTEGWWRYAFDNVRLPFAYISTQDVAREPNLRSKYRRDHLRARRRHWPAGHRRAADVP